MKTNKSRWLEVALLAAMVVLAVGLAACERGPMEPATDGLSPASAMADAAESSEGVEGIALPEEQQCPKAKKNQTNKRLGVGKCVRFGNGATLKNTGGLPIKYSTDKDCNLTAVDLRNGGKAEYTGYNGTFSVTCGTTGGSMKVTGNGNTVTCSMTGGSVKVVGQQNSVTNVNNGAGGTNYTGQTAPIPPVPNPSLNNSYNNGGEPGNFCHGVWNY